MSMEPRTSGAGALRPGSQAAEPGSPAELLSRLETFGIRLGLDSMRGLLAAAGRPDRSLPVVLVAGTNGKGSTASLLASICRGAGYRTGLYTSPHLETFGERIQVDGDAIDDGQLARWIGRAVDLARDRGLETPTVFEAITFAAVSHFHQRDVDIAILEVGLGGRLDATNACEPLVSVITPIGLDHQAYLGDSLEAIAGEKAHVLRPGRPLVAWADEAEVERVFTDRCAAAGAHYLPAHGLVHFEPLGDHRYRARTPQTTHILTVPLPGHHQLQNLALGILAAEALGEAGFQRLDGDAVVRGVSGWRWPGRLEWVHLPGGHRILLDVAHNPAGVAALVDYLESSPEGAAGSSRLHVLFGALEDKDVGSMLPAIAGLAHRLILTRPPSPRGGDPEAWRPLLEAQVPGVEVEPRPEAALDLALRDLRPSEPLVICGSVALVGLLRGELRSRFGVPGPV